MIIGMPGSRTPDEFRAALPPRAVGNLVGAGADVLVERGAGLGAGFADDAYVAVGARVVTTVDEVFGRADLLVLVDRPDSSEVALWREGPVVMSMLHLAAAPDALLDALLARGCTAIDYATVQDERGNLPALRPLSQIAGRMVAQLAARYLQTDHGGLGILLGGAPAVPPAEVVVIGAGTVGRNAVRACLGSGARVTLLDSDFDRISEIDWTFPGRVTTFRANQATLHKVLGYADVVVGAVHIPGSRTPHLVSKEMVGLLRDKSLIIDISVDQGGCFATSRPTRLSDPTYVVDGITHFCVPNLPSLVARSATYALTNAVLPYVMSVAEGGLEAALAADPALARGVNIHAGAITHPGLAAARGVTARPLADFGPGGGA
jgi:alanine dehydrogenase